jgi:LysR family glycine cleavage system transcriptional activator
MASLPSLNGLRAFEAAARHLSFTRAAEELHVTQAAVSHQIVRLEQQLGVRLFVRRNRALQLTAEAQAYLPAVTEAFSGLRRATEKLQRTGGGILTVTSLTSFAAAWLVPRLGDFQEKHPDIEVRLTTSFGTVDFRREDVDMGIRLGDGKWPGLRAEWLMAEEVFPVCSPALAERLQSPADLADMTLLHVTHWPEGWPDWLAAAGLPGGKGARNLTFDLLISAYRAASQGMGVAMGQTPSVDPELAAGRLVVPFAFRQRDRKGYFVVAPEETADQPKIRAFRDWLFAMAAAPAVDSEAAGPLQPAVTMAPGRAGPPR